MKHAHLFNLLLKLIYSLIFLILIFYTFQYLTKASSQKANIVVDVKKYAGFLPNNWKALAQGGEEKGVRMLQDVIPEIAALYPRYIRIDHIYDYYNVVSRDSNNQLIFNWQELDNTICDIYHTGAKPFLVLGYMPETLSGDNSLISKPKDWNEWKLLVQKTIERYSGKSTILCGNITNYWLTDIYYEVWNEPDLETFGKWSIHGGDKDYRLMYFYSSLAAQEAQDVNHFLIGGPATTAPYKNWMQKLFDYILENNLRIDFISWHHYSTNSNDYYEDVDKVNSWLEPEDYTKFRALRKIISEWGYDSNPNSVSETNIGAAHVISSIRNLIEQQLEMAFAFEIKDGLSPRWGLLSHEKIKKPRYFALDLLNSLSGYRLQVDGEGTYIQAIASINGNKIALILVNYDKEARNTELVPIKFNNLDNGRYNLSIKNIKGLGSNTKIDVSTNQYSQNIIMPPNEIVALELIKN